MVVLSLSTAVCQGLVQANLPSRNPRYSTHKFNDFNVVKGVPSKRTLGGSVRKSKEIGVGSENAIPSGRDFSYNSNARKELPPEPFPLSLITEAIGATKSMFVFLFEQPSQLKYIEWPGFASSLKTALFTLVLVAMLIVALSSVDSALSFLLVFVLRRPA